MSNSNYRICTIGIVAEDKDVDSRHIEVYPIELLPYLEGGITPEISEFTRDGIKVDGSGYSITLKRSMTVKADWVGENNRKNSPNVKAGEQVKLWTIEDSEKYYWEPMGRDDDLRTREHVTWAYAARAKGGEKLSKDDSYFFSIDTINKHVTLSTSKVDGEFCTYLIQVNTADGIITAKDDVGNVIQMDSKEKKITFLNGDGTFITLNKLDIEFYAPQDLIGNVDRDVLITVGRDYIENVGRDKIIAIENNETKDVGNDCILTIGNNETKDVGNDCTLTIGNDHVVEIGNDYYTNIGNDHVVEIGNDFYQNTKEFHTTIAKNITTIANEGIIENALTITNTATTSIALVAPTIGLTGAVSIAGAVSMVPGSGGTGASLVGDMTIVGDVAQDGNMVVSGDVVTGGSVVAGGSVTCSNMVTPTWNGIPQALHLKDT